MININTYGPRPDISGHHPGLQQGLRAREKANKTSMGELLLNSGHHFGLYAASSDLEALASYMATIFRVQGPLANHP